MSGPIISPWPALGIWLVIPPGRDDIYLPFRDREFARAAATHFVRDPSAYQVYDWEPLTPDMRSALLPT